MVLAKQNQPNDPVKLNQVLPSSLFHFELGGPELDCAGLLSHVTGNRQCRAHGLQNARISCGEVNVRSRAYPLNTSDLWRFWRTFLEFCCGAYVFRYQRLLRGFALLLFGSSGAIGNSCRVELVGCLPFPSPMGLSSGWKALRVQQG